MEAVFAQARDAEAASEEFLVDDGWKVVEVEPKAVEVNGNGTNGHHANGIGPTVELALGNGHHPNGNGHAPAPVNGNGHHDEAPEPQRSLFSWAEFMAEEPVKPKGRGRKPQPAATSLCAAFFAFQPARFMCAALFFCPFSGGTLIPLLRSPPSASDGPSGIHMATLHPAFRRRPTHVRFRLRPRRRDSR